MTTYLVILESLYGIWVPLLLGSPRAPMTFPRARRPLLIWMLSFSLSPVFPVRRILSDPARSTNRLSTSSRPSTSHSFTPHSTEEKHTHTQLFD
uniref:Secreted protein n=1 Tax=Esox lucius TaxID=8010 RepID=A0AAY5K8Y4_ESOLU